MKAIALLAVCAVSSAPSFAASVNMQEGKWEITTSVKVEGTSFAVPPMKLTHCYTKKEIEDNKGVAGDSSKKNECVLKDYQAKGNTATWSTVCKGGTIIKGTATYGGNVFTMTLKSLDQSGGASTTTMKGKRLGDCK